MIKKFKIYGLASSDKPNVIRYIGCTFRDLNKRHKEHIKESKLSKNKKNGTHKENWIMNCINSNLEILIILLEDNIDESNIENREIYYIEEYKKLGNTLTNGTTGGKLRTKFSEESIKKIRLSRIGKKHTEESKNKLSIAGYKRRHTEEERVKMSLSISGKNKGKKMNFETIEKLKTISKNKKSVKQFDLNGIFICEYDSLQSAMDATKVHKNSITKCCKGDKYKSAGGFIWKYSSELVEKIEPYNSIRKTTKILQFNIKNEFLKRWESATQAALNTQIHNSNIIACCKGKYKHAGGYIWKYEELSHIKDKKSIKKQLNKPVIQYTLENEFIKEYKSIGEATKFTNGHRQHISECCHGKLRSSGGYIWKFKN